MTNSRKNNLKKLIGLLVVLTLVTSAVLTGTMAKYIKTMSPTDDTARVALFDPSAGLSVSTISLFKTSYNSDKVASTANNDNLVAPGTKGQSGKITVSGTSSTGDSSQITTTNEVYYKTEVAVSVKTTTGADGLLDSVIIKLVKFDDRSVVYTFSSTNTTTTVSVDGDYEIVWEWAFNVDAAADDTDSEWANSATQEPGGLWVTVELAATFTQI